MANLTDPISQKHYSGTFAGGEGPTWGLGQSSAGDSASRFGGEMKDAYKKKVSGPDIDAHDGREESGFDLRAAGYKGPENWGAANIGTRNPDDIQGAKSKWLDGK